MKFPVTVMNQNDFEFKENKNRDTGEITQTCSFRVLVQDPLNIIQVHLTDDQIKQGIVGRLLERAGQVQDVYVDYREMKFANNEGKHVSMTRFVFIGFPEHKK